MREVGYGAWVGSDLVTDEKLREVYAIWKEGWEQQRPGHVPLTFEQWKELLDLFELSPLELFGLTFDGCADYLGESALL